MIGYGRQTVDEDDIRAVVDVLRGDFLTQGPAVERFEAALCAATGARHAVAVNSGTAALYAIYAAVGLGPGRRLWTSPLTFVATTNAALMLGAQVDFVDVDSVTGNLCVTSLRRKLIAASGSGELPDVVVAVHLTGRSCDMPGLHELSREFGFLLIEDACHALGAGQYGSRVGACQWSTAACLSFHPLKSITTGEGGAVLTNDSGLAEAVQQIRHHGITRDARLLHCKGRPAYYHEQQRLGFNLRLSDIHAALGSSQLRKLGDFIAARRRLVSLYRELLEGLSLIELPPESADSAWHLFAICLPDAGRRDGLHDYLRERGVITAVHYRPVYAQPYYRALAAWTDCEQAEDYASRILSLPLFPNLEPVQVQAIVTLVREGLQVRTG